MVFGRCAEFPTHTPAAADCTKMVHRDGKKRKDYFYARYSRNCSQKHEKIKRGELSAIFIWAQNIKTGKPIALCLTDADLAGVLNLCRANCISGSTPCKSDFRGL